MVEKDQKNINEFSRLHMYLKETQTESQKNKEMLNNLEDAETELEMADEEFPISLKFGHCFIRASQEDALEYVEKQQKECKKNIETAGYKVKETQKRANKLKSVLYSKFGNSIQLEE
jgi:prefoldin subunit 4